MLLQLAFKMESLSTVVTFIHILVVVVSVFNHRCWGVKCFFTHVALYGQMTRSKVFLYLTLVVESCMTFRLVLTYFRFSLYSTVTNVFFFLASGCVAFEDVPLSSFLTDVPVVEDCDAKG